MTLAIDYYSLCLISFQNGIATAESLKIYVVKNKITVAEYKTITGEDYVA